MSLMLLPNEVLVDVVAWSLPEGFESLALTCKRVYDLSAPFIKRHNEIRSRFRHFSYYCERRGNSLVAASDLITAIAATPIVARYIRIADLQSDGRYLNHARMRGEDPKWVPSIVDGGAVVELFARSPYLRQAGLDWRKYYATFERDVREQRYSQHGATFLLTLLPRAEKLVIPRSWEPNNATNKLLDALVTKAKQSSPLQASSLASVATLNGSTSQIAREHFNMSWVGPLLALPRLRSFYGPSCLAVGENPATFAFHDFPHLAESLQAAHLSGCCIDHEGIANFIKHTPNLKTLKYRHCSKDNCSVQDWDMCKFVNVVAREAGSHLVEFSMTISELHGTIVPGKASMRGFQKLKKLEYPLELVMCNVNATGIGHYVAASFQRLFNGSEDLFMRDLIPSSVAQLSLKSEMKVNHDRALVALFQNFRAVHKTQLPDLQEMVIGCRSSDNSSYKEQSNKIVAEGKAEGVEVTLDAWDNNLTFDWDG